MKKKIYCSALIITCFVFGIHAQPIENTTWKVYFPTGEFFAYYHLGTDTASISFDNITYANTATFQLEGGEITLVDLYDGDCSVSDTGRYLFGVQNDTLKFTLVSDPCIQRSIAMTTFHFVRFLTGIQSPVGVSSLKIHPNPSSTTITIETASKGSISIHITSGQQLLQQQITKPATTLDVSGLKSGVYVVKVVGEKGVSVGKFIRQ